MNLASAICIVSAAAATPTLPTSRGYNCAVSSHSGAGLYEITLDEGIDSTECLVEGTAIGVDASMTVVHTSDTVKTIRTNLAGVLSDAVAFSVSFTRLPAGHPAA